MKQLKIHLRLAAFMTTSVSRFHVQLQTHCNNLSKMKTPVRFVYTIFILCMLSHLKCYAQIRECSHIYATVPDGLELTGMEKSDSATTLYFRFSLTPGDIAKIPSTFYLSDEKKRKYPLVATFGIDMKNGTRCGLSEKVDFTLTFPPLPKDVKIFDLRALNTIFNAYSIWGIHD